SDVPAARYTQILVAAHDRQLPGVEILLEHRDAAVSRAVVDDDDLDRRVGLVQQVDQAVPEDLLAVQVEDDDTDQLRVSHHVGRRPVPIGLSPPRGEAFDRSTRIAQTAPSWRME